MNKIELKNEDALGKAEGLGAQGIRSGDFVFASFIGNMQDGSLAGADVVEQTRQMFKNVEALLSSEDMSLANVVQCTIYLTDMNDYDAFNSVYHEVMPKPYPARSCVQVSGLSPKKTKVEIEIIASV